MEATLQPVSADMPSVPPVVVEETDDEPPDLLGAAPAAPPLSSGRDTSRIVRFPAFRAGTHSSGARAFHKRHFSHVSLKEWNDWHWQVRHRIRTADALSRFLELTAEETAALSGGTRLPMSITPYYLSLIPAGNPSHPLRRSVVPTAGELVHMPGEADDPLGEGHQSPVPGMVHRYPDRVLLLLTDFCSTYCRYCTRSRVVGHGEVQPDRKRLETAFAYIRNTPAIRDVVLSGGDPLLLRDDKLEWVLSSLRQIPHVEIIRIGTKVPAVLPQRITPTLVKMLKRYHPLFMSLHFIHPEECTPESYRACALLADAGIPLGSQTVLLAGINDETDTMKALMHHLLKMRVRPYYLYQCDPITGSSHFRTKVETGLEIIRGLRGFTSGYGVPTYVIDAPGGGGKVPLMPEYVTGHGEGSWELINYENLPFQYPEF